MFVELLLLSQPGDTAEAAVAGNGTYSNSICATPLARDTPYVPAFNALNLTAFPHCGPIPKNMLLSPISQMKQTEAHKAKLLAPSHKARRQWDLGFRSRNLFDSWVHLCDRGLFSFALNSFPNLN